MQEQSVVNRSVVSDAIAPRQHLLFRRYRSLRVFRGRTKKAFIKRDKHLESSTFGVFLYAMEKIISTAQNLKLEL